MQLIIIKKFLQSCWKIQFKCEEKKWAVHDIFGEELGEKMFDFYKKINKKRLTILKKCGIL